MPTYEYTCKSCGETVEVFQSFSEKPLTKHDECGGELKKVFHARGVVFKGSGFYATDSRSKTSTSSSSSEEGSSNSKKRETTKAKSKDQKSSATSSGSKADS
jgi:putative FmdB family regulatory protein